MVRTWKAALVAASLACASSANAAFATFTFNLSGFGVRSTSNGIEAPIDTYLQGATIVIGANTYVDDTVAFGNDGLTSFEVDTTPSGYSFSFSPVEFQSIFYAYGSGSTGSGAGYNIASRGGYTETFDGRVTGFSVSREDSGTSFFSIVGYVPEPSTWALMLAGFGMVGYALRRRSKLSYAL